MDPKLFNDVSQLCPQFVLNSLILHNDFLTLNDNEWISNFVINNSMRQLQYEVNKTPGRDKIFILYTADKNSGFNFDPYDISLRKEKLDLTTMWSSRCVFATVTG